MENTGFNQGQFSSYTPKVTHEHNRNILITFLLTAIVVTVGVSVYALVSQKLNEDRNAQ